MNLATFKWSFFCLALSACATIQRPDANIYGVNVQKMKLQGYSLKDYQDDGNLKPGTVMKQVPFTLEQLNGGIFMFPEDFKKTKVFYRDTYNAYIQEKENCK